ncbi:hypothetical protein BC938DRAFT_474643 [Jimgerdemannia flammicorona]|uniref:Cache domain-containing protein n=1 Tax=Jimgerdemannia flammicorona TaxID=994334 RepID=A0A433Q1T0_9FUNG|nr:hypothetical protein BC938DRAFT_474643 [Jimgerdemannia flammicorona]
MIQSWRPCAAAHIIPSRPHPSHPLIRRPCWFAIIDFSNMLAKWHSYSLKKQMLITFSSSVIISLILVEIICIVFLFLVTNKIKDTSTEILTKQIKQNLADSVYNSGALFQGSLKRIAESIVLPLAQATGDTFRADQPLSGEASYFDNNAGLQAAGAVIPSAGQRYSGQTVTLRHSTWMTSNYTGVDPPASLTTDQGTVLGNSAHLDHLFRTMYSQNPDIVALYVGFDAFFFRRYPGANTIRYSGPYDPTIRPWYKAAKKYASSGGSSQLYVITDPYSDTSGRGWTVSISAVIVNSVTGSNIGVASIDLLIGTLKSNLERIAVNGSQTSLYLLNGIAIANPNWNLAAWKDRPFRYNDSSNPTISESLWQQIISSTVYKPDSQVYQDPITSVWYLIIWQMLNVTNGMTGGKPSYVSFSAFPLADISLPISAVSSDMNRAFAIYAAISIVIFVLVLLIVVTAVVALANTAVKPMTKLSKESMKISNNIGKSSLFEGVRTDDTLHKGSSEGLRNRLNRIDETNELQDKFYKMVTTISESIRASEASTKNVFHNNPQIPDWDPDAAIRQLLASPNTPDSEGGPPESSSPLSETSIKPHDPSSQR